MKKILFYLGAGALILSSCTKTTPSFKITGNGVSDDANGKMAYLINYENREKVDSALINNGTFTLESDATDAKIYIVNSQKKGVLFISEPGNFTIDFSADDIKIEGGELNAKVTEYSDLSKEANKKFITSYRSLLGNEETIEKLGEERATEIYDSISAIKDNEMKDLFDKYFPENKDNLLGAIILTDVLRNLEWEDFKGYYDQAGEVAKNFAPIKKQILLRANLEKTSAGSMFVDFEGVNPQDTTAVVKLSDFVGKGNYTLVDFWASWCGPCRAEIPHVKKAYETYKKKGLQVLGVVVWDKLADHFKAHESLEVTWPQLFDNKSVATELYGISGIPQIILFDPEGKIVQRDLRGEAMLEKIKEIYKK